MSSLIFVGCGKDKEADSRSSNGQFSEKPRDISKLPLDQAIKIKYKYLRFKCDYKLSLSRPDDIGTVSKTELKKQFYIWDLVNDYNKKAELELNYKFENVLTRILWKVEVDIISEAQPKNSETLAAQYQLTDAIVLKGSSVTEVKEFSPNGTELGSSEIHLNDKVYYDRVPQQVTNSEFKFTDESKNNTQFDLNCVLDAQVNPGYESDFRLVKK